MLTVNVNKLLSLQSCKAVLEYFLIDYLNKKCDETIPLSYIAQHRGLTGALLCLPALEWEHRKQVASLSCDFASRVTHILPQKRKYLTEQLDTVKMWSNGECSIDDVIKSQNVEYLEYQYEKLEYSVDYAVAAIENAILTPFGVTNYRHTYFNEKPVVTNIVIETAEIAVNALYNHSLNKTEHEWQLQHFIKWANDTN